MSFLLEIVFRTIIMYVYTIFLLRLLGKRGMGQLSTLELAIIISFGSAIGDPMMSVDVPILHGMVAVTTIAILQVYMEKWINRNKKVEVVMEGKPVCLIRDGIIQLECLRENNLSHEDLLRTLRTNQVAHLGQIKNAFFETSGNVTVLYNNKEDFKPGLSVIPSEFVQSKVILDHQALVIKPGFYSCNRCGFTINFNEKSLLGHCPNCKYEKWVMAVNAEDNY